MGHSWLEAKLKDVFDFEIENEITPQSRIDGTKVFLDVDFDARFFLKRMRDRYPNVKFQIKVIRDTPIFISDKDRYSKELAEVRFLNSI